MTLLLADFDPGALTGAYGLLLAAISAALCLVVAGVLALWKQRPLARYFLIAAGALVCEGILFTYLCVKFGKTLHLL
jgi:hypothetical protein